MYKVVVDCADQAQLTQLTIFLSNMNVPFHVMSETAGAPGAKPKTLIQTIINATRRAPNGMARARIIEIAVGAGHNRNSVGPTLAKLLDDKRIKQLGTGVYGPVATTNKKKAA